MGSMIVIKHDLEVDLMDKVRRTLFQNKNDTSGRGQLWGTAHNTCLNKLGFFPLQLATGKLVNIPGLTTGNVATKSMMDIEAVE